MSTRAVLAIQGVGTDKKTLYVIRHDGSPDNILPDLKKRAERHISALGFKRQLSGSKWEKIGTTEDSLIKWIEKGNEFWASYGYLYQQYDNGNGILIRVYELYFKGIYKTYNVKGNPIELEKPHFRVLKTIKFKR